MLSHLVKVAEWGCYFAGAEMVVGGWDSYIGKLGVSI